MDVLESNFNVIVHLPAGKRETVAISHTNSVLEVKEAVSLKTGKAPDSFAVVFSGKVLNDKSILKSLGLGSHSVLHVIKRPSNKSANEQSNPQEKGAYRYQFFVYCKTCQSLEPGKLRVRCVSCTEGGVVLEQEPADWDDVLLPKRLACLCSTCGDRQFAQFFFKCASHDGEDISAALRYIRPNAKSVECITCTDNKSPVIVYPCQDRHVICIDCFKTYAQVSLDNRTFIQDDNIGYTLPCPAGCDESCIQDIHHFQLLGKPQYERYKDFGAEECLIHSGGVVCPQPHCGEGMIVDDSAKTIQCETCHFEFCRQCKQDVHTGECLQADDILVYDGLNNIDRERALRARWNSQSLDTIQKSTKPCPQCATRTERNGGCMHIRCSLCKEDWCWLCEKSWSRNCQGEHWFG